jgi:addiction module HigA family antidote
MSRARNKSMKLVPVHPGEVLREEFMLTYGLSMNKLSLALRVPVTRIAEIVHERRGVTVDTALRLGVFFGTTAEFWLNLQRSYDLAMVEDVLLSQIKREVQPLV